MMTAESLTMKTVQSLQKKLEERLQHNLVKPSVSSSDSRLLTGGGSPPAHLRRSLSLNVEFLIRSISSCCFSNSCLSFRAALLAS